MLIKKLIRYCRGTLQFTAAGPYPERFLNLCSGGGVGLWNTRRTAEGVTACCAQCHRSRLEYYAQKSGCRLETVRCTGMKSTARRYRRRTGLWVGAALLAAGLLVMGRFVWRVEIRGTEQLDPAVITAALAEYGVHPGVLAGKIDARTVERRMQIRFAEIAWITVNVEGSRVTAILEEAVPPPAVVEDGIPTNLIAGETGFITRVEVQNGNAVVKPGDSVLAGDLLVSGIMDNKMGESRLAHARGRVYAQVRERLEIFVPYEQRDYLLAGVARRRYLTVFGVEIPLQGRGVPEGPYRLEQVVTQPGGLFFTAAGDAAGGMLFAAAGGDKNGVAAGGDAAGRKGTGTAGAGIARRGHSPVGGGLRGVDRLHPGSRIPAGTANCGGGQSAGGGRGIAALSRPGFCSGEGRRPGGAAAPPPANFVRRCRPAGGGLRPFPCALQGPSPRPVFTLSKTGPS